MERATVSNIHVGCSGWVYNDIPGHAIEDARMLKSMVGQIARGTNLRPRPRPH